MEHINSQQNIFYKKITGGILFLFFISILFLFPTNNVNAVGEELTNVPVFDSVNANIAVQMCAKKQGAGVCSPMTLGGIVDAIIDSLASAGSALMSVDFWAYNAAQVIVTDISTNIANKILNATNSFVEDLRAELVELENKTAEKLGIELNLVSTCVPDLTFNLINRPAWNPTKFKVSLACDPTTIQNLDKFYNNFGEGGKEMFAGVAFYQNPYRIETAVTAELNDRQKKARQDELEQLQWGQGFRSLKTGIDGIVRLPGSIMNDAVARAFTEGAYRMNKADELTEMLGELIQGVVADAMSNMIDDELGSKPVF